MRGIAGLKAVAWAGIAAIGMGRAAWGQILVPHQIDLPAGTYSDAHWVDFNRDGALDIALSYFRPGKFQPRRQPLPDTGRTELYAFNPGLNSFTLSKSWDLGGMRLAVYDIDNSGWPDILVTGRDQNAIWRMNPGTGSEAIDLVDWLFCNFGHADFRVADLNHSGKGDLVAIGTKNSATAVVAISPGDFFDRSGEPEQGLTPMGATAGRTALAVGDLDNDGFLDIVESGELFPDYWPPNIKTKVFRGDSLEWNKLRYSARAELAPVTSGSLTLFDYDGDGDLDILVTGCNAGPTDGWMTQLYRNEGNFVFVQMANTGLDHFGRSTADFADLNGDGKKDLVISGTSSSGIKTRIYLNQGAAANPIFSEVDPGSVPGVEFGSVRLGDFNSDSKPDLLITGTLSGGGKTTQVYRNTSP